MRKIKRIRTGGQTGVDRASLDFAIKNNITYCGWCPKGGLAEDMQNGDSLQAHYPLLKETTTSDVNERTMLNVKDSTATLIIMPNKSNYSKGTQYTITCAEKLSKPFLVISSYEDVKSVVDWLENLPNEIVLNIAGPRQSECDVAYNFTYHLLELIFEKVSK